MNETVTWDLVWPGMWIADPTGRYWKVIERDELEFVVSSKGEQRTLKTKATGTVQVVEHPQAEADALALVKKILGGMVL